MSKRTLRRRRITPATNQRSRRSPSLWRLTSGSNQRSPRPPKRSRSEPSLSTFASCHVSPFDDRWNISTSEARLDRPHTCTDIFEALPASSPGKFKGYKKDVKVVVNVTVEGCPGPVRTMVKLAANVEDTIRLVISKYNEEGRTPLLDKETASNFQLHHSHFTLASLSKTDVIGDVGARSFYLCRGSYNNQNDGEKEIISASFTSDIVLARSNTPLPPDSSPHVHLSSLIYRTISKMIARTHKIWKIFGCFQVN